MKRTILSTLVLLSFNATLKPANNEPNLVTMTIFQTLVYVPIMTNFERLPIELDMYLKTAQKMGVTTGLYEILDQMNNDLKHYDLETLFKKPEILQKARTLAKQLVSNLKQAKGTCCGGLSEEDLISFYETVIAFSPLKVPYVSIESIPFTSIDMKLYNQTIEKIRELVLKENSSMDVQANKDFLYILMAGVGQAFDEIYGC